MSVWTTLSETDTTEVAVVPGPPAQPGTTFTPFPPVPRADPGRMTVAEPQEPPTTSGRRALREARRKRQLAAAVCVVVVAALLAITIMIVGIARDRPATPSSSGVAATSGLPGSIPSL
ncbi:MAG TPA: hypothetical protein VG226_06470 [Acidimicrobiales bacterium]|jgi:hypothetical protein|nr:hypothetical protein [Acidimicrobiales bacterium]